jgi:hypothetical protein
MLANALFVLDNAQNEFKDSLNTVKLTKCMSTIYRDVMFAERKSNMRRQLVTKVFKNWFKSQVILFQLICDQTQELARQNQRQFGPQLIRWVPNLKNTGVKIE